jgi:solute carrier family 25 phosphate transporter 23/24/25/41
MATTVTHPLDVARLRISIDLQLRGTRDAFRSLWMENGLRAMYKGWIPTVISVSPFIAINFASFDILKQMAYPMGTDSTKTNPFVILSLGGMAGIFAQTICYPLDTIRRRMQMKGRVYSGLSNAFLTIYREEGVKGYYRGIVPNAVKVVPNNAIRFLVYEWLKTFMSVQKSGSSSE